MSVIDQNFMVLFNEKLQDIRDICMGGHESLMNMDTTMEEKDVINENQLWDMFEDIKTQVKKMDISGVAHSGVDISLVDSKNTEEDRRWFEGSYYICKICDKKEYGDTMFRTHLKKEHKLTAKDTRNLSEFCTHFQQLKISCQLCHMILFHDYSTLSQHIKSQHFMSIVDYENKYVTGNGGQTLEEAKSSHNTLEELSVPEPDKEALAPAPEPHVRPMLRILSPSTINGKVDEGLLSSNKTQAKTQGTLFTVEHTTNVLKGTEDVTKKMSPSESQNTSVTGTKDPSNSGLEITGEVSTPNEQQEVVAVKREPMEHVPRTRSLYYCPLKSVENPDENCSYFTNKQGFMNHTASRHIIEVHKLKAKEMQPGQCKFKKVKVERD